MYEVTIAAAAANVGIDKRLVTALISVESGGNPWAWNPEPRYRYFWDVVGKKPFRALTPDEIASEIPPADFLALKGDRDHEWWGQAASWGLMQVMGAIAREQGWTGPYLTMLCDPGTNVEIGCKHLAGLMSWAHGNETQALAAYNGGKGGNGSAPYRNAAYAAKVLAARI